MSPVAPRPGLFTRWLLRYVSGKNRRELERFVGVLAELNDTQVADLLLGVGMIRRDMERNGLHPMDPLTLVAIEFRMAATHMAAESEKFTRRGSLMAALACSVWGHTFRAATDGNLRPCARLMWRELMRGAPGLRDAENRALLNDGVLADVPDAAQIPAGFS